MAPDKVLSIMNSRINSLESQMKIQLVTNQMLKSSLAEDTKVQDRYDELSSKIVLLERQLDTEKRRVGKIDKQIHHLQTVQSNVDRSLKLIDQKIALLTSAHFSGISGHQYVASSGAAGTSDSILQLLQTPLPELNGPSEAGGVGGSGRSTMRESQRIQSMKSFLREKRLSSRIETSSPPPHGSGASGGGTNGDLNRPLYSQLSSLQDFDEDGPGGLSSVDSQGLLDEYVLERIDNLDSMINDTLLQKVHETEKLNRQMTHELKTVQDTVKELEVLTSDKANGGGAGGGMGMGLLDYDYNSLQERNLKSLSYDLKEHWEKVLEETDKKLQRIDLIMKQSSDITSATSGGTSTLLPHHLSLGGVVATSGSHGYDDITKKLFSFKNKLKLFFESFSQCMEQVNANGGLNTAPPGSDREHSNHSSARLNAPHSNTGNGRDRESSLTNRELILNTLTPLLKDLLHDSYDIQKTEMSIKDSLQQKLPGQLSNTSLPVSCTIQTKLPELLKPTQKKTIQFLNKGISKLQLQHQLTSLLETVSTLVPTHLYQQTNEDMKIALTLKADQKTVDLLSLKKASLIDLQKFREYVNDEIDSMRETLVKNASNSMKLLSSLTHTSNPNGGAGNGTSSSTELEDRFQILLSQFLDLKKSISGYVPRTEIESALQAILEEIRVVKRGSVERETLQEKLKMKADRDEIDKLLNLLSASIGSPLNGTAIAMHLKCLSCDKPINPFLPLTGAGAGGGTSSHFTNRPITPSSSSEDRDIKDNRDSLKGMGRATTASAVSRGGGGLLTSKSTSQLPPVGYNNTSATVHVFPSHLPCSPLIPYCFALSRVLEPPILSCYRSAIIKESPVEQKWRHSNSGRWWSPGVLHVSFLRP
jgi:hypothetical protein